jgi:hypothetical protein
MSTRRTFIRQTAAAVAGFGLSKAIAAEPKPAPANAHRPAASRSAAEAKGLSAYAFGDNIWVRVDDKPFTCYRTDGTQKYPYFFPVCGPLTGQAMTDESGALYPHHRSLYLACDRVNGGDYWQEAASRGQIVSRGPKLESQSKDRVVIKDVCDWRMPEKDPVFLDERTWTITAPSAGLRIIDAEITLTAKTDIHITQTNHALFSIRCAPDLAPANGGTLINSNGQRNEAETFGQAAAWAGFQRERACGAESIVLMDHPKNPWSPCKWFTRDYGFMSPMPFNFMPGWDLASGKSIRLRNRVLVMSGLIEKSAVEKQFADFAAEA